MTAERSRPAAEQERAAVVLPVKAFHDAKGRLAGELEPHERQALAVAMADRVVAAAAPLPVYVVADDPTVTRWARSVGATVVDPGRPGLDRAARAGVEAVRAAGFARVVISHADLPLADDLVAVAAGDGVTLVTDRHGDGTNVLVLPTSIEFDFAYGPGSRARHVAEAGRRGQPVELVSEGPLCWDVDVPEDLSATVRALLAASAERAAHG
ncbi:MAG: 2-phospho-L-lactate guanylyltransferase [Actinomycetota bacterium]